MPGVVKAKSLPVPIRKRTRRTSKGFLGSEHRASDAYLIEASSMKLSNIFLVSAATTLMNVVGLLSVAHAQEIYRDPGVVMGYLSANEIKATDGYDQCFTSIGDYLWLHSDNSANKNPLFRIQSSSGRVSITKNKYVDGRGVYVCYNARGTAHKIKAGYATSGTSIGAGLSCVTSVANFIKLRVAGAGTGTVTCSYNRSTGVITASQTGAGRITQCGYVCADPANTTPSHLLSFNSTATSGTRLLNVKGSYALGTNTAFSQCSNTFITEAAYNAATGVATQGRNDGCGYAMFSYLGVSGAQCADGIDNDGDGLSDKGDPGCWANPQDPNSFDPYLDNEAAATSQCQDGVDNDKDGLADLKDPGCSSPQDNYEGDGTSQCQNGFDDDRDGLTDLVDPGCSNPQDNNEGDGTSQCQNGIDDDRDGLTDLVDPGCSNPQDNNESDGTSQCQNGIDDDRDGLTDLVDPGCSSPQDTNEADGTSQCQNGFDDDKDGLVDMKDPGCSSPQDLNEGDPVASTPTPTPPATATLTPAPTGTSGVTGYRVTPIVECVDALRNGNLLAHFGYRSDEMSSVTIPVGAKNFVAPGAVDAGQPTTFYRGAFGNVFTVIVPVATPQAGSNITSSLVRWTLGEVSVEASAQTARCSAGEISCDETNNKDTLSELDNLAARQRATVRSLASRIRGSSGSSSYSKLADSYEAEARKLYLDQWTTIWSKFPQVTKACTGCAAVDTTPSIADITNRSKNFVRLTKLAGATLKKARRGSLKSSDEALVNTGTSLHNRTVTVSEQLPRFDSQCG